MINIEIRGRLHMAGQVLIAISTLLTITLTAMRLSADNQADAFYLQYLPSLPKYYPLLAMIFLICYLLGYLLKGFNYNKWVLEVIQKALDDIQADIFKKDHHAHENRVTLFRWKRFCFRLWHNGEFVAPWQGWLSPFLRSGHTSKASSAIFMANTASGEHEGVAGKCWSMRRTICIGGYEKFENTPEFITNYAKDTKISTNFLEKRIQEGRHVALSYLAIPIEIKGRVWGVVVVDSVQPDAIKANQQNRYDLPVSLISKLIERLS